MTRPAEVATIVLVTIGAIAGLAWLAWSPTGALIATIVASLSIAGTAFWYGLKSADRDHDDPDYGGAA